MFKVLLIAVTLAAFPFTASAQATEACKTFAEMAKTTAVFRDAGLTASDAYVNMVNNGVPENVALTIIKIVYDSAKNQTPENIAIVSEVACIQATSN